MRSWTKPTSEQVSSALAEARRHPVLWRVFLAGLKNPHWAQPLFAEGVFNSAPAHSTGLEDSGSYSYDVLWPEGSYLSCVATENAEVVRAVLKRHCQSSNPYVKLIILQGVAQLSGEQIAPILKQVKSCAPAVGRLPGGGMCLATIVMKLFEGGCFREAKELATRMWAIDAAITETGRPRLSVPEAGEPAFPRSAALMSERAYTDTIRITFYAMVESEPLLALKIFWEVLIECVKFEQRCHNAQLSADLPSAWRHSIEGGQLDQPYGWFATAINAVRDSALAYCKAQENPVDGLVQVVKLFGKFEAPIFQRIELFLFTEFMNEFCGSDELVKRAFGAKMFEVRALDPELLRLVRWAMPKLEDGHRRYLVENWRATFYSSQTASVSWRVHRNDMVQEWFGGLYEFLPMEFREEIDQTRQQEMNELSQLEQGLGGEMDPDEQEHLVDVYRLRTMPVRKLVDMLRVHKPSSESTEELNVKIRLVLLESIELQGDDALSCLPDLVEVAPSIWQEIIWRIGHYAFDAGWAELEWEKLLEFMRTISEKVRHRSVVGDPQYLSGVLFPIAHFTRVAVARDIVGSRLLPLAWEINENILEGAEMGEIHDSPDEVFRRLNDTVLGMVQQCAIEIMASAERMLDSGEDQFDELRVLRTQVWDTLRARLTGLGERASSARATCGGRLRELIVMDSEWVVRNLGLIFPHQEEARQQWCVAWSSYVQYCGLRDKTARIVMPEYDHALTVVNEHPEAVRESEWWPLYIEHLSVLILFGTQETAADATAVWTRFVDECDGKDLLKSLSFIGKGLVGDEASESEIVVTMELQAKSMELWENVYQVLVADVQQESRQKAAAGFGWWFSVEIFGPDWLLTNMIKAVEMAGHIENLSAIVEGLARSDRFDGLQTLRFMDAVATGGSASRLTIVDAPNVMQVLRNVGRVSDEIDKDRVRNCLERFASIDSRAFSELYNELIG